MKNEYRKMCSRITPDEKLTEKTLKQFAGGEKVHPHKRRAWKPAAAVVAGLLAFAVAFPYIQSTGNHIVPTTGQNKSATNTQNTFGLAVYAADKTHSGNTAVLQMQPDIGQYCSTGASIGNYVTSWYKPNLQCTGTNLKTVEYSLETSALDSNEQAYFVHLSEDFVPDMSTTQKNKLNLFTIDYQKENIDKQMSRYGLALSDKLTASAWKEHCDKYSQESEQEQATLQKQQTVTVAENAYRVQASAHMAQILSKTRVILKATFLDSSVQTQTYQMVPRGDFNKNLAAYFTFESKLCAEFMRKFPRSTSETANKPEYKEAYQRLLQCATAFVNQHPLFNITQLSAAQSESKNSFNLSAYAADKGTSSEASGNEITFALETGSSAGPNGIKSNASFQITGTNIAKIAVQLDRGKLYQMERVTKQLTSKDEKAEADAFMAAEDKTKQIDADISTFSWQEFKRNGVKEKPSQALYIEGKMLGKSVSVPYDKKYSYGLYAPADEMSKIDPPTAEGKTLGLLYGQHLDKAVAFFDGAILQITATYKDGTCETKTLHLKTENRRISYDGKNEVNIILPKDTTNTDAPIVKVLCADIT